MRVPCGNDGYQGFEVGVAIMKQFRTMDGDEARTAEKMAQALHAKWGVGASPPTLRTTCRALFIRCSCPTPTCSALIP